MASHNHFGQISAVNYSLRGSNPRPMAHKTIALTTELREQLPASDARVPAAQGPPHQLREMPATCGTSHVGVAPPLQNKELPVMRAISHAHMAAIAQLAARRSHNPKVVSSILTRRKSCPTTLTQGRGSCLDGPFSPCCPPLARKSMILLAPVCART